MKYIKYFENKIDWLEDWDEDETSDIDDFIDRYTSIYNETGKTEMVYIIEVSEDNIKSFINKIISRGFYPINHGYLYCARKYKYFILWDDKEYNQSSSIKSLDHLYKKSEVIKWEETH